MMRKFTDREAAERYDVRKSRKEEKDKAQAETRCGHRPAEVAEDRRQHRHRQEGGGHRGGTPREVGMIWNGAKLAALREAAGLTPRELAEAIKATSNDIRRWEAARGRGEPRGSRVADLTMALRCQAVDLFDEV